MSNVVTLEPIETEVTESDIYGNYHQITVKKYAHKCMGCGLVWAIKWHAADCEKRGHKESWQQAYPKGPIINGVPRRIDYYPRRALRREPIK